MLQSEIISGQVKMTFRLRKHLRDSAFCSLELFHFDAHVDHAGVNTSGLTALRSAVLCTTVPLFLVFLPDSIRLNLRSLS
jgi:hypothetical protein